MGHSSIKKEGLVEDSVDARDIRLERRLKRRSVANQSFINNSFTKGIKRTAQTPVGTNGIKRKSQTPAMEVIIVLDEDYSIEKTPRAVSAEDDLIDKEYKAYLNILEGNPFNPSEGEDDLDPQYKMFWENVREDGSSFVLQIAVDKDMHILLKYEEDDRPGDEGRPGSHNLRTAAKRENMENPKISKDFAAGERKTSIDKKLTPDLSKKASSRGLSSSEPKCKHEPEPCDTGIDESYKIFLECLKEEGNCLIFVNKHGKQVKYEEESESESEMLAAESDPCIDERKETPCEKSKSFESSHIKKRNKSGPSQFRDKLMVTLTKPYDQSEYEELLQEIGHRKPLERHRNLRGRIKSYSLEICSKSYLDHHTDLKRKIDAVQGDRYKTLNLLRGFFYWLKMCQIMDKEMQKEDEKRTRILQKTMNRLEIMFEAADILESVP